MNRCIKCGCQIPEGELFCMECGLNPGSSLFDEPRPAPVGRMQTPVTKPSERQAPVAVKTPVKKRKNTGLKVALALVSLLLALSVGLTVWRYADLQAQWNRLETKEADLLLREREIEELELALEEAQRELETLRTTIEKKDSELSELRNQLSGTQSDQSQGQYDQYTMQTEMERLEEENKQLLLLEEELKANIKELTTALEATDDLAKKAQFLDDFVVFAENDGTQLYHTYDCPRFNKKNFWAYSRKLAEASGFTPCSTCKGIAE